MDPQVFECLNNHDYQSAIELLLPNLETVIETLGRDSDEYYTVLNLYLQITIGTGMVEVKDLVLRELSFNQHPEMMDSQVFLNKCLLEICFLEGDFESVHQYAEFLLENLDTYFEALEETGAEDADEIMGQYKELLFSYAKILLEQKNLEKALDVLDLVCSLVDTDDEYPHEFFLEKKATVLSMLGQHDEAIEFLNGNLIDELTPDAIIILRKLGVLYMNKKQFEEALVNYVKCLEILEAYDESANASPILADLASLYHEMGNEEAALDTELKIIDLDPYSVNMSSDAFSTAGVAWQDMDTFTLTVFARLAGIENGEYVYRLPNPTKLYASFKVHGSNEWLASSSYDYEPARVLHFQSPSFANLEDNTWIQLKFEVYDDEEKTNLLSTFYQLVKKAEPPQHQGHGHSHGGVPCHGHGGDEDSDDNHGHSHGEQPQHGHSHGGEPCHGHGEQPQHSHSHGEQPQHGHSHGGEPCHGHGEQPQHSHSHGGHGHSH